MTKLAVAIAQCERRSILSDCFSKSKFFLVHNPEDKSEDIIKNPFANELGRTGIQSARFLIENNVDSIIVKNIGINPFRFLTFSDIKIYQSNSNHADKAITDYHNGNLELLENLNDKIRFRKRIRKTI